MEDELKSLDELIEEITVDAYGEDEKIWAFVNTLEEEITGPSSAEVMGEAVEVLSVDYNGDERRGRWCGVGAGPRPARQAARYESRAGRPPGASPDQAGPLVASGDRRCDPLQVRGSLPGSWTGSSERLSSPGRLSACRPESLERPLMRPRTA